MKFLGIRSKKCLLQDQETLKNLLLNHVISGKLLASDIEDGMIVTNLAGNELELIPSEMTAAGVPIRR